MNHQIRKKGTRQYPVFKHSHLICMAMLLYFSYHPVAVLYANRLNGSIILAAEYGIKPEPDFNFATATANTERLNDLLKKQTNLNNTIVLPAGCTWISAPVHIPSGITIAGNRKGSSIAIASGFANAEEGFIENEHYNLGTLLGDSAINLENFTIDGRSITPVKGTPRGFFLNKVKNVNIRNITVLNTVMEGIRIDCSQPGRASTENILIEGCRVERRGFILQNIILRSFAENGYNSTRIPSGIAHVVIRNNVSIGGYHGVLSFNAHDVRIENNYCLSNSQRGINVSPTNSDIIIRNNRIDSAGSAGIILAFDPTNITIDSNHVTNTLADMSGIGIEGQGIKVDIGFLNIKITHNTCTGNATDGIALEGGGFGKDFVISNNTCTDNHRNGIRIWAGELNQKNSGDMIDGTVENNTVNNNREDAIYVGSDNGKGTVKKLSLSKNKVSAKPGKKAIRIEYNDGSVKIAD